MRVLVDLSPAATGILVPIPVSGFGTAFFGAPVPNYAPGLAGLTVYCQWAIVGDPSGQPTIFGLPLAITDGLSIPSGSSRRT